MIKPYLFVASSNGKGRGVFTNENIRSKSIIEISPVIVLPAKDRKTVDQTLLHDYIFEWGDTRRQACIALGYVSLYNHSFTSNCEYEMDYEYQLITIRAVRSIKKGEELFINYNGTWDDTRPLWFEVTGH
ncbi:MAG TPA: SET domain-containing protein [Flavitalea sp.]|nr:SET domain-containing protein [Flavitalea sp.]